MATRKQTSTGEAIAAARQSIATARVGDPGEHFPYKAAVVRKLLDGNQKLDPGDGSDVRAEDFMSRRIAESSAEYIAAQERWLLDPSEANRSAYEAAKDDLAAARRTHRRNRVDENGNPVGGVVGLTDAPRPQHMRGVRHRRVGEE